MIPRSSFREKVTESSNGGKDFFPVRSVGGVKRWLIVSSGQTDLEGGGNEAEDEDQEGKEAQGLPGTI